MIINLFVFWLPEYKFPRMRLKCRDVYCHMTLRKCLVNVVWSKRFSEVQNVNDSSKARQQQIFFYIKEVIKVAFEQTKATTSTWVCQKWKNYLFNSTKS